MMIFKYTIRVATTLLLLSLAGTQAHATTLADITPPGWPRFETDVSVKWQRKDNVGFKLEAKLRNGGDMFFRFSPTESYQVTYGSYKLKANLDNSGTFLDGDLKITGSISHYGISDSVLLTATLNEFAYNGNTLAFNTTITGGEICIVVGCTISESVWVNLDNGGFDPALKQFTDTGTAITTIPVPAAVWLFGSGILGLVSVARRKRNSGTA